MSDPSNNASNANNDETVDAYGEPVAEPTESTDGDVVGNANSSLAEAEAARRDAVAPEEAAAAEPNPAEQPAVTPAEPVAASPEPVAETPEASAAPVADTTAYAAPAAVAGAGATAAAHEPYTHAPAATPAAPQPIFVQAPEAPRPRGNRGAAGAIGLLAALVFAVLYLGAALGFGALAGDVTIENVGTAALAGLMSWWFWVPVAVFFLGFWLLGAVLNRGRWGYWVIWGIIVGFIAYGGHLLGQLFQEQFWLLTPTEAATLVAEQLFAPLAVVAFILGREITIWFGAWVAARGRRVTELNIEAQREYERTLEAGPQLHRG